MSESIKGKVVKPLHENEYDFEELRAVYMSRYQHKTGNDQKSDLLLYALILSAIENFKENRPVSIQRMAEITFAELVEIQEHLPLILEVYPDIGIYYEREQTFTKQ